MDPLSIAAGAAGLVTACIKITTSLYSFIEDTRGVDSNITVLCDEVLALSRVLDAIVKSWKQSPYILVAQADQDRDLWLSVKASIDDCKKTLEKLEKSLDNVTKESIFGRWRPAKAVKLNMKMRDILMYRQQIQSYSNAMQSALQMINLCLLIHGQSSQGLIERSLRGLRAQINRLESGVDSLQNRNKSDMSTTDLQDAERMSNTLRSLAKAAESFHSSASTVAGGSTIWGASIRGEPLNEAQFRGIEEWIPPAIPEEESIEIDSMGRTQLGFPSANKFDNRQPVPADPAESDSDVDYDLVKKFQELAVQNLAEKDYSKAEMFYRRVLDWKEENGGTFLEIAEIKMQIAFACCCQDRWQDGEDIVVPIAMAAGRPHITTVHMLHGLALWKIKQDHIDAAEKWCKKAASGKKKLLGKQDSSYHESMVVLSCIYQAKGDSISAEACRTFSPSNIKANDDPRSYLLKELPKLLLPSHLIPPPILSPPVVLPLEPTAQKAFGRAPGLVSTSTPGPPLPPKLAQDTRPRSGADRVSIPQLSSPHPQDTETIDVPLSRQSWKPKQGREQKVQPTASLGRRNRNWCRVYFCGLLLFVARFNHCQDKPD